MMYSVQRKVATVLGWPPVRAVVPHDFLCRTTLISREYGADRGTTIDRYYIESFLGHHSGDVRGTYLKYTMTPIRNDLAKSE
jgi:integrase